MSKKKRNVKKIICRVLSILLLIGSGLITFLKEWYRLAGNAYDTLQTESGEYIFSELIPQEGLNSYASIVDGKIGLIDSYKILKAFGAAAETTDAGKTYTLIAIIYLVLIGLVLLGLAAEIFLHLLGKRTMFLAFSQELIMWAVTILITFQINRSFEEYGPILDFSYWPVIAVSSALFSGILWVLSRDKACRATDFGMDDADNYRKENYSAKKENEYPLYKDSPGRSPEYTGFPKRASEYAEFPKRVSEYPERSPEYAEYPERSPEYTDFPERPPEYADFPGKLHSGNAVDSGDDTVDSPVPLIYPAERKPGSRIIFTKGIRRDDFEERKDEARSQLNEEKKNDSASRLYTTFTETTDASAEISENENQIQHLYQILGEKTALFAGDPSAVFRDPECIGIMAEVERLKKRNNTLRTGTPDTEKGKDLYCPGCGAKIEATDAFCYKCGRELKADDTISL